MSGERPVLFGRPSTNAISSHRARKAIVMTKEAPAGCRFCKVPLVRTFVDLGMSPLCQTHLEPAELNKGEEFFPLHVFICENCMLVQLQEYVTPDKIFTEY